MAIRDILLMGEPVLRRPADEVTVFDAELERLVEDMFETMYHAEGVGLAAPQIGVSKRIIVVDARSKEEGEPIRVALINPEIIRSSSQTEKQVEGCLSIPGIEEMIERPVMVEVRGRNPKGEVIHTGGGELYGRALQHEIDHLNGILIVDRVSALKRRMALKKWKKLQEEEEKKG
jgi:peptide deformylase